MDEFTQTKRCRTCTETKPTSEFHRNKSLRDGLNGECKPCATERVRAWAAANPERKAQIAKRTAEKNQARLRERSRAYYAANRDVLRSKNRTRYATDAAYRERQLELVAAWISAHPERMAEHYRAKRARRQMAPSGPVDLAALWTGACGICGTPLDASIQWPDPMSKSVDHIVALINGGTHTQDNLQWTHLVCNLRKGARR